MKTIGFVCEGPRDSDMLEAVVSHILDEDISPLYLQPESSLTGENGNGWKGVWSWCVNNGETLDQYMQGATPKIDMIIIQLDGDVARKEREIHCSCYSNECPMSGKVFPLKCTIEPCPVVISCDRHEEGTKGYVRHLQELIQSCFSGEYIPVCVIPCDSTDAWIVAAFDEMDDIEDVEDPWTNIISRRKTYHGVRVPGHKKTKYVYEQFIRTVCKNWDLVKERCLQAKQFDRILSDFFVENCQNDGLE